VAITVGEEILSGFAFETGRETGRETGLENGGPGQKIEGDFLFVRPREPNAAERSAAPNGVADGADESAAAVPVPGAKEEIELVTEELAGDATGQRLFQHRVWVRRTPDAPGALLAGHEAHERLLPMKRPIVVPDGQGALLVRAPQLERRISLPRQPFASTLDRFGSELTIGSLALLTLGLFAAALVAHRITRPLGQLTAAAERVGGGELGLAVPVERRDEIGAALRAFNTMSSHLATLDRENRRLTESEHLSELAEVARGLAHTLRNPLNALGLAVDELAEQGDSARARELGERSRRQIRRIDGSLRSFLALASAPAASPEPVELGALAREVALEALQDAGGRVKVEVDAAELLEIVAVGAEVKAIVQALVVNACEASPEGGRVVVRVTRDAATGGAKVEIDDEGAGVAPAVAERLFAPHVTTKPNGSGMGLYLAQRLATHRYGGGVTLAPRPSHGTRATLTLGDRAGAAA
jgi:signal transduction histidine kinase